MRVILYPLLLLMAALLGAANVALAAQSTVLFQQVRVFDGQQQRLSETVDVLVRGFTSVRDLSGPVFGLKRAIDDGIVKGPRIWPSGAMISQTGAARQKQQMVQAGTDTAIAMAKKHKIKLAWGTDILFNPRAPRNQGAMLATMQRWFSPAEVLQMTTSTNAELLALSGPRNPYPGQLGVVKEGALADLLLVEGNPLQDLSLIADPQQNFVVIMKDGVIYKNHTDTAR